MWWQTARQLSAPSGITQPPACYLELPNSPLDPTVVALFRTYLICNCSGLAKHETAETVAGTIVEDRQAWRVIRAHKIRAPPILSLNISGGGGTRGQKLGKHQDVEPEPVTPSARSWGPKRPGRELVGRAVPGPQSTPLNPPGVALVRTRILLRIHPPSDLSTAAIAKSEIAAHQSCQHVKCSGSIRVHPSLAGERYMLRAAGPLWIPSTQLEMACRHTGAVREDYRVLIDPSRPLTAR